MIRSILLLVLIGTVSLICLSCENSNTLRVSKTNPRYFTDNSGKAIYLTGSHTWNTLVDMYTKQNQEPFDFDAYLDFMEKYNHNFLRLWAWELFIHNDFADTVEGMLLRSEPFPWKTIATARAYDGNPKFDLNQFNQDYFNRLKDRVAAAGKKNIFVSVMLFEGWGEQFLKNSFRNHPFHPLNNVNNIHVDTTLSIHELGNQQILEIEKAYVKKVVESLNGLDNVLFEISNENHPASSAWQYFMIRYIRECEEKLPGKHPVGMTFQYEGGRNKTLYESPADWISPNAEGGFKDAPLPSDGSKVIISDTDHLWGLGGNHQWVWKSFLQGMNPIFMDPYDGKQVDDPADIASLKNELELIRKNMGYTLTYSKKIDLINTVPDTTICTSGYCLAKANVEYLIYFAKGREMEINFTDVAGVYSAEWFDPVSETLSSGASVEGGKIITLVSPFSSDEAVLYLKLL